MWWTIGPVEEGNTSSKSDSAGPTASCAPFGCCIPSLRVRCQLPAGHCAPPVGSHENTCALFQTDRRTATWWEINAALPHRPLHRGVRSLHRRGEGILRRRLSTRIRLSAHTGVGAVTAVKRGAHQLEQGRLRALEDVVEQIDLYARIIHAPSMKRSMTRRRAECSSGELLCIRRVIAAGEFGIFQNWMWSPHQVTLHFIAGLRRKKIELRLCLDALRQHRQIEPMCQPNDGTHDGGRLGIALHIRYK